MSSHILAEPAVPLFQVPELRNVVVTDGRVTNTNEWSDASNGSLRLDCGVGGLFWVGCGFKAPVDSLNATVWVKHDATWLYLLYQVPRITYEWVNGPEVWINYCYSATGREPWIGCDVGSVYMNVTDRSTYAQDRFYKGTYSAGGNDITKFGGQLNAIGAASFDKDYYWFELKKMLNSGDTVDWVMVPGKTYGVWDADGVIWLSFGDSYAPRWGQSVSFSLCPCIGNVSVTTTLATATSSLISSGPLTTTSPSSSYTLSPAGSVGVFAAVALVGIISAFLVVKRRRHGGVAQTQVNPAPIRRAVQQPKPYVSTGYEDLDGSLDGGIPLGYAVVLVSPAYDERDLLLRRTIDSSLSAGMPVYYVSNEMAKTQDLILRYPNGLHAFCTHADKIANAGPNLHKIPGIDNLSDANLTLTLAVRDARAKEAADKSLLIIDILSDIVLRHKALVARRWVSDFVGKRKSEGFTVLATLNPLIGSKEETQPVIDFFDGIIEIYERSLAEKARHFLIVRKMFGRRYSQAEIMLEIERLW